MKKILSVVLIILLCAVIFILAGALGVFYQAQKDKISYKSPVCVQKLESKVITSVIANGRVDSINGNEITLISNADSLKIITTDNTQIISFLKTAKGFTPTKIGVSSINKGDLLTATLIPASGDILQAQIINISPSSIQSAK